MVVRTTTPIAQYDTQTVPGTGPRPVYSPPDGIADGQLFVPYRDSGFRLLLAGGVAQAAGAPPAEEPAADAGSGVDQQKDLAEKVKSLHVMLKGKRDKVANPGQGDDVKTLKEEIQALETELAQVLTDGFKRLNFKISFTAQDPEPVAGRVYAELEKEQLPGAVDEEAARLRESNAAALAELGRSTGSGATAAGTAEKPAGSAPDLQDFIDSGLFREETPPADAAAVETPPADDTAAKAAAQVEAARIAADAARLYDAIQNRSVTAGSKEILSNPAIGYRAKAAYMALLAEHYNKPACTQPIREEILNVFEWALLSDNPDIFYAAFAALGPSAQTLDGTIIYGLNDEKGQKLAKKFIFAYARHVNAQDGIGKDTTDNRLFTANIAAIKRVFSLMQVAGITDDQIAQALFGVIRKYKDPEQMDDLDLFVAILMETIPAGASPQIAIGEITGRVLDQKLDQKTTRAQKLQIMKMLARVYNNTGSDENQRAAVLAVFENVRPTDNQDAFYAGIAASGDLSGNLGGTGEKMKYAASFAKHMGAKDDISKDTESAAAYADLVNACSYALTLRAMGFTNDNVDAALQRLVQKPGMFEVMEGDNLLSTRTLLAVEGLKDRTDLKDAVKRDVWEVAINSQMDLVTRSDIFINLALLFNTGTNDEQREVTTDVFTAARKSPEPQVFFAGLEGAKFINDDGNVILEKYIAAYARHISLIDAVAQAGNSGLFISAIDAFAKAQPDRMMSVIGNLNARWFKDPTNDQLWLALMHISTIDKECFAELPKEVKVSAEDEDVSVPPERIKFRQAVDETFKSAFRKSGAKPAVARNFVSHTMSYPDAASTQPVDLAEFMIKEGDTKTRQAVIAALDGEIIYNADVMVERFKYSTIKRHGQLAARIALSVGEVQRRLERTLADMPAQTKAQRLCQDIYVRLNLKLMEHSDARALAIAKANDCDHNLPALLVYGDYLTKPEEPEHYRDRAHAFFRDDKPVSGGRDSSPRVAFGIHRISSIEQATAGGKAAAQCKETLKILHAEWRRHNPRWDVSLGIAPPPVGSSYSVGMDSADPAVSAPGLELRFGRATAASEAGWRTYLGAYSRLGFGDFGIGASIGKTLDITDRVHLSLLGDVGYLKLFGDETDGVKSVDVNAFSASLRPQLNIVLFPNDRRWHRGLSLYLAPQIGGYLGRGEERGSDYRSCGSYYMNPETGESHDRVSCDEGFVGGWQGAVNAGLVYSFGN